MKASKAIAPVLRAAKIALKDIKRHQKDSNEETRKGAESVFSRAASFLSEFGGTESLNVLSEGIKMPNINFNSFLALETIGDRVSLSDEASAAVDQWLERTERSA